MIDIQTGDSWYKKDLAKLLEYYAVSFQLLLAVTEILSQQTRENAQSWSSRDGRGERSI